MAQSSRDAIDPVLGRGVHDRRAEVRADAEALEALRNGARFLLVAGPRVQVESGQLAWSTFDALPAITEEYFLGTYEGVAYFAAVPVDEDDTAQWATLRELADGLPALEVGLLVHAVALSQWHARHSCCARCGATTSSIAGGSARRCERCESEHYPRTDPAVIVLVKDADDRILLGRQAVWPEGRFSTFAGFVEPGESFEAAVSREVLEEAGVRVEAIEYLGSQPWPFPASIMIAFRAVTAEPQEARPDGTEIEQVRWFSRGELQSALTDGSVILPPRVSIARAMIESWFGDGLDGGQAWR